MVRVIPSALRSTKLKGSSSTVSELPVALQGRSAGGRSGAILTHNDLWKNMLLINAKTTAACVMETIVPLQVLNMFQVPPPVAGKL